MNGMPSFNIFIMQPPAYGEKMKNSPPATGKKSALADALRKKEGMYTEMMEEFKKISKGISGLPHTAHSGGG